MTTCHGREKYRWVVLSAFILLAGVSEILWTNFSPLLSQIQKIYGVSELMASSLILVFPFFSIFLSLPAGAMADHRGYKFTIGFGAVVMMVFACVRIYSQSFWALLIGQIGIAIAQPYIITCISKLVVDWFSEQEIGTATGLGTLSTFLGIALGMAVTPFLVKAIGFQETMVVFAAVTLVSGIAFFWLVKEKKSATTVTCAITCQDIMELLKTKSLRWMLILSFIGFGYFTGLITWLEAILEPNGISFENAGLIGGLLTIGGIVGSVVLPWFSDLSRRRKPYMLLSVVAALLFIYPFCTNSHLIQLYILGTLTGFFVLPSYALVLTMAEEVAGAKRAGTAVGMIFIAGGIGSVVVPVFMELAKGGAATWINAVLLLMALALLGILAASFIPETYPGKSAEA